MASSNKLAKQPRNVAKLRPAPSHTRRQRDRETERQRDRETERQRDRHTHIHTHTHIHARTYTHARTDTQWKHNQQRVLFLWIGWGEEGSITALTEQPILRNKRTRTVYRRALC